MSLSRRLFVPKCLTSRLVFFHPSFRLSVSPQASSHAGLLVSLLTLIKMDDDILRPLTLQLHSLSYLKMSPGVLKATPSFHSLFYNSGFLQFSRGFQRPLHHLQLDSVSLCLPPPLCLFALVIISLLQRYCTNVLANPQHPPFDLIDARLLCYLVPVVICSLASCLRQTNLIV